MAKRLRDCSDAPIALRARELSCGIPLKISEKYRNYKRKNNFILTSRHFSIIN
jgi:hypothetical protein